MNAKLQGKLAVISGASAGIGAEFARELHRLGCRVVLIARRKDRLNSICNELNASRSGSADFWSADLTSSDDTEQLLGVESVCKRLSEIAPDIFINNAGVGSFGELDRIPYDMEQNIIELNIAATTRLAHSALHVMKKKPRSYYVSVSSIAGYQPLPYMATYSASKAYNLFHSLALRREFESYGVSVTVVCPGPVDTEFFGVAQLAAHPPDLKRDSAESVVRESVAAMLCGRPVVFPGIRTKVVSYAVRLMPYRITTFFVKIYLSRLLSATQRDRK